MILEVENKNYAEYKSIRILFVIPIILIGIAIFMSIMSIINKQLIIQSISIFIYIYLIPIGLLNYLNNFSHTRYYTVKVSDYNLILNRGEKIFDIPISDIKQLVYLSEPNITGSTKYLMIITTGLKKNIYLSNYKSKKTDLGLILSHPSFQHKKVIHVRNILFAQIVIFFYLTFGLSK